MLHSCEIVRAAISLCGYRRYTFANTYTHTQAQTLIMLSFTKCTRAAASLFRLNRGVKRAKC